jgi:hypothetical protein
MSDFENSVDEVFAFCFNQIDYSKIGSEMFEHKAMKQT